MTTIHDHIRPVPLTAESEAVIRRTFARYTKAEGSLSGAVFNGRFTVHCYPTEDTDDGTGELSGYFDSLLFTARLYDLDTMTYYEVRNRDAIRFEGVDVTVQVWKDGSTCVAMRGPVVVDVFQSMTIRRPR